MENVGLVAERYAQALAQTVRETDQLALVRDEVVAVARLFTESAELQATLKSPIVDAAAKQAVMNEIAARLQVSQLVKRFLTVVGEYGRFSLLPAIAKAVARAYDERAGIREVELRVAAPLDADMSRRLEAALVRATGGKVRVRELVDPSLIGGVVAKVGTLVYDGSLRTKLEEMRLRLSGRTSMENAG